MLRKKLTHLHENYAPKLKCDLIKSKKINVYTETSHLELQELQIFKQTYKSHSDLITRATGLIKTRRQGVPPEIQYLHFSSLCVISHGKRSKNEADFYLQASAKFQLKPTAEEKSKYTSFNHMKVFHWAGGSRTSQENSAISKRPQTREQANGRNDKSSELVQILTLIKTYPFFQLLYDLQTTT